MKSFEQLPFRSLLTLACAGLLLAACDGKREHVDEATFRVETVGLEKSELVKGDTFGLAEEKMFYFKACFTDANSRTPISISNFVVSDGGAAKEPVATDKDGCLTWTEVHKFSALQREEVVKLDRTFYSPDNYKGSITVSLSFNPWQEKLVDLRKSNDPDLDNQATQAGFQADLKGGRHIDPFSEAALADVSLKFYGHDVNAAEITPLLTLKPAQRFRLSLKPQFLRRNLRNEVTYLDLKSGQFKVRLVVIGEDASNAPTPSDIVADSEAIIDIKDRGLAQKDLIVRIHDISAILSRNQFYLIAEPVGVPADLAKPAVYKGYVGPLAGNDALVDLIPYDGDAPLFISNVETSISKLNEKVSAMDLFEEKSGLKRESGTTLKGLVKTTLDAKNSAALREFCSKVYAPGQTTVISVQRPIIWWGQKEQKVELVAECLKAPLKYLHVEKREIVQDILDRPRQRADLTGPKTIKINKDLRYAKTQASADTRNYQYGYGWGANAAVGGELSAKTPDAAPGLNATGTASVGFGLKGNIGTEWGFSEGLAKSENVEIGAVISESQEFQIASIGYDLRVSSRSCLLVGSVVEASKGFFGCSDDVQERTTTETYYQVNHTVQNSVFSDSLSASSTMWRITIRGKEKYKAFEDLMTKGSGVLQFSELKIKNPDAVILPGQGIFNAFVMPDFKVNQSFPGVLSGN